MSENNEQKGGVSRRELLGNTTKVATLAGIGAAAGVGTMITPAQVRAASKKPGRSRSG